MPLHFATDGIVRTNSLCKRGSLNLHGLRFAKERRGIPSSSILLYQRDPGLSNLNLASNASKQLLAPTMPKQVDTGRMGFTWSLRRSPEGASSASVWRRKVKIPIRAHDLFLKVQWLLRPRFDAVECHVR